MHSETVQTYAVPTNTISCFLEQVEVELCKRGCYTSTLDGVYHCLKRYQSQILKFYKRF